MKIYDTEKEARDAAEAFDAQCEIETDIVEIDNGYKVGFTTVLSKSIGFQPLAQFRFKPERVAPAQGQAVMNQVGAISYSMGVLSNRPNRWLQWYA
jgi:hypothetical protein